MFLIPSDLHIHNLNNDLGVFLSRKYDSYLSYSQTAADNKAILSFKRPFHLVTQITCHIKIFQFVLL